MHPSDCDAAASFLSATRPRQQQEELLAGAAAASSSPSRGTRAGGENAGVRCQDGRDRRAAAYCAHCRSSRGFVVYHGHVNTTASHVPATTSQQQTLAASASTAAAVVDVEVEVEPIPKRPHSTAVTTSVAAAPTTISSVDRPIATTTALQRFAREVSLDAVFRRVRLGGGPAEPEVAYYTTVTIAGHVFRGILCDVGPHSRSSSSSSTAAASDTDGSGEFGSSLTTAGDDSGRSLDLTLGL